jgi:glutathione-regulated potassium-efflux system ancillary protein KefG
VAPTVDPDDLVDAVTVAEILGLTSRGAVSVYRSRYDDFPAPVIDLGKGRPMLWLRADVEAWKAARV